MDKKVKSNIQFNLTASDSGHAIVKKDFSVHDNRKQHLQLSLKDKEIEELHKTTIVLQDKAVKYKEELEKKEVIADNEKLKEEAKSVNIQHEQLIKKYQDMTISYVKTSRRLQFVENQLEDLECERNDMSMNPDFFWEDWVSKMMQDVQSKCEENDKIKRDHDKIINNINKILKYLGMEEKLENQMKNGEKQNGSTNIDDILKVFDVEVWKVVEERNAIIKSKKQLSQLAEFLEFENQTLKDENNKKIKQLHKSENVTISLVKSKEHLQNRLEGWISRSGKLRKQSKANQQEINYLKEKCRMMGKLSSTERVKRIKMEKVFKSFKQQYQVSKKIATMERRQKNALGTKYIMLQVEVATLKNEITHYDNNLKSGIIESITFDEVTEKNKELGDANEMLKHCIKQKKNEQEKINSDLKKIKIELESELKIKAVQEDKSKKITTEKKDIENNLKEERCKRVEMKCELDKCQKLLEQYQTPTRSFFQRFRKSIFKRRV